MKRPTFDEIWKENDIDKALGVSISGWVTGNTKFCKKLVKHYWDKQKKEIESLEIELKKEKELRKSDNILLNDCIGDCENTIEGYEKEIKELKKTIECWEIRETSWISSSDKKIDTIAVMAYEIKELTRQRDGAANLLGATNALLRFHLKGVMVRSQIHNNEKFLDELARQTEEKIKKGVSDE